MTRIFIAMPVYQYPEPETLEALFNVTSILKNKYDFRLCLVSGYSVDTARTEAVKRFLATDCNTLLFVDGDIVVTEQAIEALIQSGKEAVTALYFKKSATVREAVAFKVEENVFKSVDVDSLPDGPAKIDACGFGCVLLERDAVRKVFERTGGVPFRFMQQQIFVSEDIYFCNELMKAGIDLWLIREARVPHVGKFIY